MRVNFNWTDEEKFIFLQQHIQNFEIKGQGRSQIDIENIININPQAISSVSSPWSSGRPSSAGPTVYYLLDYL